MIVYVVCSSAWDTIFTLDSDEHDQDSKMEEQKINDEKKFMSQDKYFEDRMVEMMGNNDKENDKEYDENRILHLFAKYINFSQMSTWYFIQHMKSSDILEKDVIIDILCKHCEALMENQVLIEDVD